MADLWLRADYPIGPFPHQPVEQAICDVLAKAPYAAWTTGECAFRWDYVDRPAREPSRLLRCSSTTGSSLLNLHCSRHLVPRLITTARSTRTARRSAVLLSGSQRPENRIATRRSRAQLGRESDCRFSRRRDPRMLYYRVRSLAAHVTDPADPVRLARPTPDSVPEALADRQRVATEPVVLLVGRRRVGRTWSRSSCTERTPRLGEYAGTDISAAAAGQRPVGAALSVPVTCSNAPWSGAASRKRFHEWTQSSRTASGRCNGAAGDSARAATAARCSRESGRGRHPGRDDFNARSEATAVPGPGTATAAASSSSRGRGCCCRCGFGGKYESAWSDAAARIDAAANLGCSGTTSSAIHVGSTATTTTTATATTAAAAAAPTRGCDCRSPNSRNLNPFFLPRRQHLSTKVYRQFCNTCRAKCRCPTSRCRRSR